MENAQATVTEIPKFKLFTVYQSIDVRQLNKFW